MARSIVTSENKTEYDEAKLSPSTQRAYLSDAKSAESASKEAKDHMSHAAAARAHKRASIYASPENIEKHLSEAKRHSAEARKMERLEKDRYVKERLENDRKASIRANKARGVTASSDEEKRTGKYTTY
jgi:outer membrane cobalamin receptor